MSDKWSQEVISTKQLLCMVLCYGIIYLFIRFNKCKTQNCMLLKNIFVDNNLELDTENFFK